MFSVKAVVISRREFFVFFCGWEVQARGSVLGSGEKEWDDGRGCT